MDIQFFVQNVKSILDKRKISYSRAGRESGAGMEFIRNMERYGTAPSIEKVAQMADYLGITVGELLGEELPRGPNLQLVADLTTEELDLIDAYRAADERAKQVVDLTLEPWKKSESAEEAI